MSLAPSYTVKTSLYEGPLDALLDLIERRKLLINDISLSQVTDDYIKHVGGLPELPLGQTAEFVALAATLLLIKSRSLLPMLELSEGERSDIETLKMRLALHQIFRRAAGELRKIAGITPMRAREAEEEAVVFAPDHATNLAELQSALHRVIAAFPMAVRLPQAHVSKIISLEEMIARLSERITRAASLSFQEFSGAGVAEKTDVIVSFLALLELVKQGIIRATQHEDFGDITLQSDTVTTPSYE